jgi:predicted O-methyltransferase YrrM
LTLLSEGRFTAATARCPHPERWLSRDVDSTEQEVSVLLAGLVRALQPDLIVETGTAFGETARMIAETLEINGQGRLVTIEIDKKRAERAKRFLNGYCEVIHGSSLDWTPDGPIGFLFLDSAWDTRVPEFHHFAPWLNPGAIIAIHDTAHPPFRVEVEREILSRYPVKAIDLPTPRGLMLIEVLA